MTYEFSKKFFMSGDDMLKINEFETTRLSDSQRAPWGSQCMFCTGTKDNGNANGRGQSLEDE
jgi:hypothetical protein